MTSTSSSSSSWSEDLLVGLAEHLAAAGVGEWRTEGAYPADVVAIVLEELLDDAGAPDEQIVLSSYDLDRDAFGVDPAAGVDPVAVQVRTRTRPGVAGSRRLDDAVYELLEGAEHLELRGVHVLSLWRNSGAGLGRDTAGRRERVSNYYGLAQRGRQQ